jgi:hypothetical protein
MNFIAFYYMPIKLHNALFSYLIILVCYFLTLVFIPLFHAFALSMVMICYSLWVVHKYHHFINQLIFIINLHS